MDKTKIKEYLIYLIKFIAGLVFFSFFPLLILLGSSYLIDIFGARISGELALGLLAALLLFLYIIILRRFWEKNRIEFYVVLVSLILALMLLSTINIGKPGYTHDHRRTIEIRHLSTALQLYFNEHGTYPIVSPGCQDTSVLDEFLSPTFVAKVPRGVLETYGGYVYPAHQYAVSNDGVAYVLKTTLKEESNALEQDLDGNILGCDCEDPNYCLSS